MKFAEMKDLTVDELRKKDREMRESLFQARMKNQMGQLNNPLQVREIRRDIARIQTVMNQKLAQ